MQRLPMSDTTSGNEWQQMAASGLTNESKWKRIRANK